MPPKRASKPKTSKKSSVPKALIVVAHPDDETIFFSGLMQTRKRKWHVICVSDGNADQKGGDRQKEFAEACKRQKVSQFEIWNFPDIFEKRLDVDGLIMRLSRLQNYKEVFTHGILGEYGHPHHQDVSFSVHAAFQKRAPVFSVAYSTFPDIHVSLSRAQFNLKTKILWEIYHGEVERLIHYLPATSSEGFVKVGLPEVRTIYQASRGLAPLDPSAIKVYRWLVPYLQKGGGTLRRRDF